MLQSCVDIWGVLQRGARKRTNSGDLALRDLLYQVYIRLLLGKYALNAAKLAVWQFGTLAAFARKTSLAKNRQWKVAKVAKWSSQFGIPQDPEFDQRLVLYQSWVTYALKKVENIGFWLAVLHHWHRRNGGAPQQQGHYLLLHMWFPCDELSGLHSLYMPGWIQMYTSEMSPEKVRFEIEARN